MNTHVRSLCLTLSTTVLASGLAMAAGPAKHSASARRHTQLAMADSDMKAGDEKKMDSKMGTKKGGVSHHRKHMAKKRTARSHKKAAAKQHVAKKG
jgi:hypothetical protein